MVPGGTGMTKSRRSWVALGSNLGDRVWALEQARERLSQHHRICLRAASRLWETEPVGPPGQGPYLNAVLGLDSSLEADALLKLLLDVERALGRCRDPASPRWGPRLIDLDLLLFGSERIHQPGLEVPHPRLRERPFVLAPLNELVPKLQPPGGSETVAELLAACPSFSGSVRPWAGSAGGWSMQPLPANLGGKPWSPEN